MLPHRTFCFGRAEEEMYGEVTEAEKMHTLRVILVRPDGRVEHNVYLDLKNASVSDRYGKIRLKVQGNEEKTIYLLGNEGSASVELPAVEGEVSRVSKAWGDFKPGDKFLAKEQMAGLVLSFDNVGAFDKTHPLPMSECHTVMLDDEGLEPDNGEQGQTGEEGEKVVLKKKEITLKLTRAAVKFTYEITNKSSRDYWLSVIRIDKSASHEYLLPNGMTYDDAENVTDFQVPAAKYTPFNQLYKENKKLTAKSTEPVKLPSFYLSEGKYENANDTYSDNTNGNNYKTSYKTAITLDTKDNSGEVLGDRVGNTSFGSSPWKVSFRIFLLCLAIPMWWCASPSMMRMTYHGRWICVHTAKWYLNLNLEYNENKEKRMMKNKAMRCVWLVCGLLMLAVTSCKDDLLYTDGNLFPKEKPQ